MRLPHRPGDGAVVDEAHSTHMARALELAERAWGGTSPNPMVGAVVVRDGEVVGEGHHRGPGTAHAEIAALHAAGDRARGATLYTTLEPCNRFGRTPPCTRGLIDAGVARVVVGASDPNLGSGEPGVSELRAAGVEVVTGILRLRAERLNRAFLTHVRRGRPFVILKMASTLDGKAAAHDGTSKWISGPESRADVQRLRAWADAIAVGSGTVLADDPSLTVRDPAYGSATPPLRVVVDTSGRIPATQKVFDDAAPTLVATTELAPDRRLREWRDAGADVVVLDRDPAGGVSLEALTGELGKRDVQGLLIEGGPTLAWSAIRDRIVDSLVVYLAPKIAGGSAAHSVVAGGGFAPIAEALDLDIVSVERLGTDIRVEADVHRDR